ncbi:HTH domain-containing protein [Bacillus cereus]|uniref:Helix-turn-helix domain-containing protein n=3 Tax=Bacillus cereus group TaxID=86661 RepID=A0AAW5L2G7_BACCE|nr:HTH domain-containing protein [Bacillus cereus]MCQ6288401.1 helix-turn-helix domain-containing protein [Bacillus cereus]MCQ6317478.1 helix-turn-helix domain-containing protein [Bacillus cereus]MCQ6328428.1 helix-turn-helix domain-containing protein [Bacillus cereus]MCQ6385514.1 helix-turn-helix domain-containing protein [Bacillus cereus]
MKKLTAYNADVQKYMQQNRLSTQKKYEIIDAMRKRVDNTNQSFESLFPSRSKRKDVMDHIIYMLSGNGICKISAETLADKADCSVRTVNAAVHALKQTGEIVVAGLADGKNKYVFVLKMHSNFTTIMKEIFYINTEQIAELNAGQVAEQKNDEPLETVRIETEKTSSNYNNSINSFNSLKQEKNNDKVSLMESIEIELKEAQNDFQKEFERIHTYFVNEYQEMMYHTIKAGTYHPILKTNASIIGLRVGSNCDENLFHLAFNALGKIDRFLKNNGILTDSVQALFTKVYTTNIKLSRMPKKTNTGPSNVHNQESSFIFYNWLEDTGSKEPATKTIDSSLVPGVYYKISKEESDEMGLY